MIRDSYAGIGARETPKDILKEMEYIGETMCKNGWVLRSGAAPGADQAFEKGCDKVDNLRKEIFLPWEGFEGHPSGYYSPWKRAYQIAQGVIPWWDNLSDGAKKLHARNAHQILGHGLNEEVKMVICWTEGGKLKGGTATAIKIAKKHDIPVINLAVVRNWSPDKVTAN